MISIYVAAPYACAGRVRAVHDRIVAQGMRATSTWATDATGPEKLDELGARARERIRQANGNAIRGSDGVIILAYPGGCETLVELGLAVAWGLPVAWVDLGARLPLSATCPSVCARVASVDAALEAIVRLARMVA